MRYWIVTGASSGLQLLLLFLLTTARVPYLLSNLAGIAAAAVWNFRLNNGWTWKSAPAPLAGDAGPGALVDAEPQALKRA